MTEYSFALIIPADPDEMASLEAIITAWIYAAPRCWLRPLLSRWN